MKVTFEQLNSVSARLNSGSEDVSQQLQAMEGQVKGLVDADWDGAGSDAFRDLWDKWHRGAAEVKEALDGISQMLGNASREYQDKDQEIARGLQA